MTRIFWLEQTEADLPASDEWWLGPDEAASLAGMRFQKRRNDFRLGRWTGKRALSLYLKLPPSRIEIRADPWGAPEALVDREQAAVNISISHRAGVAACVIAPGQVDVGCDLELMKLATRPSSPTISPTMNRTASLPPPSRIAPRWRP